MICISQISTIRRPLAEDLESFAATGWDAVEVSMDKVRAYLREESLDSLREAIRQSTLKVAAAIGFAPTGPQLLLARNLNAEEYMSSLEEQLKICAALGIRKLGIGSDPTPKEGVDKDWRSEAIYNLRAAAALAERYDVSLGLEFVSLGAPVGPFLLENLRDTFSLIELVGHPNLGLNLDVFHFVRGGGTIEEINPEVVQRINIVHVCDVRKLAVELWTDGDRVFPGEGIVELEAFRDALLESGYNGHWSLELLNEEYWEWSAEQVALTGIQAMRQLLPQGTST